MSWWEAHSIRSKMFATIRTFHIVPNPGCNYTVTFMTSSKYNHIKNTISERVSSHIRGHRRCCALSDRTVSNMLALASTTHHAVMLSATYHRPQYSTALQGLDSPNTSRMAPTLSASQHRQVGRMLKSRQLTATQMATKAGCSKRTIQRLQQKMRCYNDTKAPSTRVGRRRSMTPHVLDALCEKLLAEPGLYTLMHLQFPLLHAAKLSSNAYPCLA
jgi:hypothetical protein